MEMDLVNKGIRPNKKVTIVNHHHPNTHLNKIYNTPKELRVKSLIGELLQEQIL